jgi:4-hydroxy-tetrahydrodipicolinate reductase
VAGSVAGDRTGPVGVVLVGAGRVGRGVLELASSRPWLEVRGLIGRAPEHDGVPATDLVAGAPAGLRVSTDAAGVLRDARPEVVIVATRSELAEVAPVLDLAAASGARAVLCTAEELAFVGAGESAAGDAIRALPGRFGARIVAAGVNPGFVLDLWPLVLSGLAWDVERLTARRVVDVSVFAPHTRVELGIGHTPAAFAAGVADGSIAGHAGFRESLRLLCSAMGREPERLVIETLPIVTEERLELADGVVEAGLTAGAAQRAEAWIDGRPWIAIELLLHVRPAAAGLQTTDSTHLVGRHDLRVTLDPGCGAILSTAALLVNTIPVALRARPGLYAPGELPPAAPWLGQGRPPGC